MQCHIIRVGTSQGEPDALTSAVRRASRSALPLAEEDLVSTSWTSTDGSVGVWSWSNEGPPATELQRSVGPGVTIGTGYSRRPLTSLASSLLDDPSGQSLVTAGGIWSVAAIHSDGVIAATSLAGIEPWFTAHTDDAVWLGNRALLVHLASRSATTPVLDRIALAGMVNAGYPMSERTPYEGTTYAGAGVVWSARRGGVDGRVRTGSHPLPIPGGNTRNHGEAAAEALTAAVSELPSQNDQIRFGLTGGRDSRLIVAALAASGASVTTQTRGAEGHSDVVVAERVARTLGLGHKRIDPSRGNDTPSSMQVDPIRRIYNAVVLCDGQISAYDSTGGAGTVFSSSHLGLSGSGGEVLRGGYARIQLAGGRPDAGLRWLRDKTLFPLIDVIDPDVRDAYRADVQHWIERVESDPVEALARFYREQRGPRWFGSSRLGTMLKTNARTLFLDDAVLSAFNAAPTEALADESILRDTLRALDPRLVNIPFVGNRLVCDRKRPLNPMRLRAWRQREPLPAVQTGRAGFQWKLHYDNQVADVLRRETAREGSGALADGAADRLLPSGGPKGATARLAWAAATVGALSDPGYYAPEERYQPRSEPVWLTRPD